MGVKYNIAFKAYDNRQWRIDLEVANYLATPIQLRGSGDSASILSYDPTETDNPFSELIKSTLDITVLNENNNIDISELQQSERKDLKVTAYRENILYWVGYLNPAGLQKPLKSIAYPVQLVATDGLDMLETAYVHNNLPGLTNTPNRCIMNYFRQVLFATANLGLPLPIRWTNDLKCTAFPTEFNVFVGSARWSNNGEGFASFQANAPNKPCLYILSNMLKSMQCRLYQAGGKWVIRRIPNVVSGSFKYYEIPATLGTMVVQSGTENVLNQIGRYGYPFINENQVMTSIKGLKTCKVTYNANIKENILPNGNQDLTSLALPLYWGSYDPAMSLISVDSINGSGVGFATEVYMPPTGIVSGLFTMVSPGGSNYTNGLPIDTQTMVKKISFGFVIFPQNGFPVDENNVILWDQRLYIQVVFNLGSTRYYLNEFGFFTTTAGKIPLAIDGLTLGQVGKINFDRFQGIIMKAPASQPVAGDISDIQILFEVEPGQRYTLDDIYINIENGNDVFESTLDNSKNTAIGDVELEISSSYNGYMVSNFMSNWGLSDSECFYSDGLVYEGTLTGLTANAIMRYRYLSSDVFNGDMNVRHANWGFDEMYLVDSEGMTVFLPVKASYNIETCVCGITAIECRNDNIALTEKYYSSNDEQLSN